MKICSNLAVNFHSQVRYKIRPSLEMLEWKEFGAWLVKGWHVDPEVRPSATKLLAEFEGLPGLSARRHRI
jgi:hypothetical protein